MISDFTSLFLILSRRSQAPIHYLNHQVAFSFVALTVTLNGFSDLYQYLYYSSPNTNYLISNNEIKIKLKFCMYSAPSPLWHSRLVDFIYYK